MLTNECHQCENYIEFPDHGVGEVVPCPHCGKLVQLTADSVTTAPEPTELASTAPGIDSPATTADEEKARKTEELIAAIKKLKTGPAGEPVRARAWPKRKLRLAAAAGLMVLVASLAVVWFKNESGKEAVAPAAAVERIGEDAAAAGAPSGLFGTKWMMSMAEVTKLLPAVKPAGTGVLGEAKTFYERPAFVAFHFTKDALLLASVNFYGASSRAEYEQTQARLIKEYGPMPRPAAGDEFALSSTRKLNHFVIQHVLLEANGNSTEQVLFYVRGGGNPKQMPKAQIPSGPAPSPRP